MTCNVYLETTGLQRDLEPVNDLRESGTPFVDLNYSMRKAALERAHEIRKFEIELYWKRANYFWLLQAAVFAAIGLIWKGGADGVPVAVPVALAALGTVTAAAGWFSAQGSKFWQENWEHHIDMLEDDFEGRLHKTAYVGKYGLRWSVSGVNDRLSICFFVFWLFLLAAASHVANPNWTLRPSDFQASISLTEIVSIACWIGAALGIWAIYSRPTELKGNKVEFEVQDERQPVQTFRPRFTKNKNARPYLVDREPKT